MSIPTETTSRLGFANAAAGLVIALLAPVLGAIADRGGAPQAVPVRLDLVGRRCLGAPCSSSAQGDWDWPRPAVRARHHGFQRRRGLQRLAVAGRRRAAGARSRLGVRLRAGLSGRRRAVPRQRADGPEAGLVRPCRMPSPAVRVSFLTVAVWWLLFTIPLMRRVREQQSWRAPGVPRRRSRRIPRAGRDDHATCASTRSSSCSWWRTGSTSMA